MLFKFFFSAGSSSSTSSKSARFNILKLFTSKTKNDVNEEPSTRAHISPCPISPPSPAMPLPALVSSLNAKHEEHRQLPSMTSSSTESSAATSFNTTLSASHSSSPNTSREVTPNDGGAPKCIRVTSRPFRRPCLPEYWYAYPGVESMKLVPKEPREEAQRNWIAEVAAKGARPRNKQVGNEQGLTLGKERRARERELARAKAAVKGWCLEEAAVVFKGVKKMMAPSPAPPNPNTISEWMAVYHPLAEQAAILRAALDEAWQEPPRESKAFDALMAKNAQLAGLEGRLAALGRLEDVPEAQIEGHDSVYWAGRWSAQRDREAAMRAGIAINCE